MSNFNLPKMPEFKATKSGYEIRADILDLAKAFVVEDFHAKHRDWELTIGTDPLTKQLVTTVGMPQFPGLEQVLDTAERMYAFVNQSKS